jgi:hypothetical protein
MVSQALIKRVVRTKFTLTTRDRATAQISGELNKYLALAEQVGDQGGVCPVRVPRMAGVDEDMRDWSFFMLLEHHAIVNRTFAEIIQALAGGELPPLLGKFDPKKDVMPSPDPGPEQVRVFASSVEDYLALVPTLGKLRGSLAVQHPLFGEFDAHKWHCMFGFHLNIHQKQVEIIVRRAQS